MPGQNLDSFAEQVEKIPTSVDRVELRLHCNAGTPNTYEAYYEFYILDQNGDSITPVRAGNAIPHLQPDTGAVGLSAAEFNGLQGLMDKVLLAAQGTLPTP